MSSSSNAIQAFLAEFVVEAMREKAHGALCDLFATLHAALALEFVHAYSTTSVPSAPTSEPHVAPPATKKSKLSQAQACSGKTAKGEACTRKCCPESPETFCSTHLAQSLKEPKVKAPAPSVSKKAMRAQVPLCSGKTAKGEACTRKCCPESDTFCSTHLAQSLKPAKQKAEKKTPAAAAAADKKPKKSSASASSQKPVPTHNHALTEEVEANCDLCQTHGNAADPELTTSQFEEISGDLQSRLKSILANLHEVPDDDDDEEDDDEEAESALVKPDADDDQAFGDAALESEGEEEPEEEEEFEDEEESESEVDED
jgi:hypothetical protein